MHRALCVVSAHHGRVQYSGYFGPASARCLLGVHRALSDHRFMFQEAMVPLEWRVLAAIFNTVDFERDVHQTGLRRLSSASRKNETVLESRHFSTGHNTKSQHSPPRQHRMNGSRQPPCTAVFYGAPCGGHMINCDSPGIMAARKYIFFKTKKKKVIQPSFCQNCLKLILLSWNPVSTDLG